MKSLALILSIFVFSFFTTAQQEPVSKKSTDTSILPDMKKTFCGITLEAGFNDAPRGFTSSGTWVTGHFGMQANYDIPSYWQQFYGTLDVDCRPGTEVHISETYGGYSWYVNIKTDGKIYISYGNGGFIPAGTYIDFHDITFSK